MELGNEWRRGRSGRPVEEADRHVPEWADWTGDPFFDLYAHVPPGTAERYSSAGFWRLSQALTAVWNRDLKTVLDDRLFSALGIRADRWDWHTGRFVAKSQGFYPTIPDSYTYLDPPFEVEGHAVRSGPGWVEISAADLARFGHLLATGGIWQDRRVMDPRWLRGHAGGNRSGVSGEGSHFTAMGMVTTDGIDHPHSTATASFIPEALFSGPVQVSKK
jgi:CubicO group peptidase (beta-lactamase class C family)